MAIPINFYCKQRAFLDDPNSISYLPSKAQLKECPIQIGDYRNEITKIKQKILQSNNNHFLVYHKYLMSYNFKSGQIHEIPNKLLLNLLGIHSISESFLQTQNKIDPSFEPLIIETGNLIHNALKEERLDAFYFENYGKIIVLSSSLISSQELKAIFERQTFTNGFYPIVEDERTDFGDLKIHLSDVYSSKCKSFTLPLKEEIFTYLLKDKFISEVISPEILTLISEKLENIEYIPEITIFILAKAFLNDNILLGYTEIMALDKSLVRYPKEKFHPI